MRQVACEIMRQLQESHIQTVTYLLLSKQKYPKNFNFYKFKRFSWPMCLCTFNGMIIFLSSDLQTFKDPWEPCYTASMTNSLVQYLTNKLQTFKPSKLNQHTFGSQRRLKNTLSLSWSFWPSNTIRLQSTFLCHYFFGHLVSLFPDLFFWGLANTTQMFNCLTENRVRMSQEWRRGRKNEKRKKIQKGKCHNDVSVLYM